jgi:hypothetical protein
MLSYLVIGLILVEVVLQVSARTAVAGTRQRYVLMSFRRICSWLVNFAFIAQGLLELVAGQPATALWNIVFGSLCIFIEIRSHKNDDDWFNGRGTKIKRGIKKLLTTPVRLPVSAPAPAFGMLAG